VLTDGNCPHLFQGSGTGVGRERHCKTRGVPRVPRVHVKHGESANDSTSERQRAMSRHGRKPMNASAPWSTRTTAAPFWTASSRRCWLPGTNGGAGRERVGRIRWRASPGGGPRSRVNRVGDGRGRGYEAPGPHVPWLRPGNQSSCRPGRRPEGLLALPRCWDADLPG